jgi:hypothetical protein
MKVYKKERWNSLNELKDAILREGKEEFISFNGYEIITNKHIYRLVAGTVCVTILEDI